jgi:hypothetical protein
MVDIASLEDHRRRRRATIHRYGQSFAPASDQHLAEWLSDLDDVLDDMVAGISPPPNGYEVEKVVGMIVVSIELLAARTQPYLDALAEAEKSREPG